MRISDWSSDVCSSDLEKFREFNRWLRRGGMSHIAHWCETFEDRGEGRYIMPGEIAPTSASKRRLITESRSDADVARIHIAEEMKETKEPVAVALPRMNRRRKSAGQGKRRRVG